MCGANECSTHWALRTSRPSNPRTLEYWAKSPVFISGKDSIALLLRAAMCFSVDAEPEFPPPLPFATILWKQRCSDQVLGYTQAMPRVHFRAEAYTSRW